MDLARSWRLRDEAGDYNVPFTLPGDGISALHAAGVIPDPYCGLNECGLRWTASRSFDHDGSETERVIDGLDTPQPWKAYRLTDPQITQTVTASGPDHTITVSAKALAPFDALESDLPGRFSDNAFLLISGQDRTIRFTPTAAGAPRFTLHHLFAATYGP